MVNGFELRSAYCRPDISTARCAMSDHHRAVFAAIVVKDFESVRVIHCDFPNQKPPCFTQSPDREGVESGARAGRFQKAPSGLFTVRDAGALSIGNFRSALSFPDTIMPGKVDIVAIWRVVIDNPLQVLQQMVQQFSALRLRNVRKQE